jgi:hypothetical protein
MYKMGFIMWLGVGMSCMKKIAKNLSLVKIAPRRQKFEQAYAKLVNGCMHLRICVVFFVTYFATCF